MAVVVALLLVLLACVLFCVYFAWDFDYWRRRGVPSCNALSLFGDRGGGLPFGRPFYALLDPIYAEYKVRQGQRFAGTFQARRPVLVVFDPELCKAVLTRDFASFRSRGQGADPDGDPLSANLFNLDGGPRWKNLRAQLSPAFTSGKLKNMFPLMVEQSERLNAHLAGVSGRDVDFRDLLSRSTTDLIGSVAFGVECNSLPRPGGAGQAEGGGHFYAMSRAFVRRNVLFVLRFFLVTIHPALVKLVPFRALFRSTTDFFLGLVRDAVEHREAQQGAGRGSGAGVTRARGDFVDVMMQVRDADRLRRSRQREEKAQGEGGASNERTASDSSDHIELSLEAMTAQALVFYIAGLDGIANTVGFALHELALNEDLQTRAAAEVRGAAGRHGGGITYDALRDMELVERIIRETLRKWSPVGVLFREANGVYKIPDSDVVIDGKALVWIPVWQMMHDPEHFPDPERFDPERFTEAGRARRHAFAYLPFGEGPRFCFAERFAVLQVKLCLAALLHEYEFALGTRAKAVPDLDPKVFFPNPKDGLWLRVRERRR